MNKVLKRYKLDNLLYELGNESREMFIDNKPMIIKSIQGSYKKWEVYQSIWDMIDISYLAICNSNDYRSKILKKEDIVFIINNYRQYDDELCKESLPNVAEADILLYILYGHSQEQFIYQSRGIVKEMINRNIELLQYIPKKVNSGIDIDFIIKSVTNFSCEEFNEILFVLALIGAVKTDITKLEIPDIFTRINPTINDENLYKIIELYSSRYSEYRESNLKKHYLKTKPIVKTDNGRILVSNQYLLYNLLIDASYWIVRNYYGQIGSQDFTNAFGVFYEKYLQDIFEYYLDSSKFEKLQEDNKSAMCDWKIETDKYIILIEQKSAIASIFTKNIYPNISQVRSYLNRLGKGFNQLKITEQKIDNDNNKTIVKLLVHYELLYISETLEVEIIKSMNSSKEDYNNTFLVSTSEMERLVYALSEGEEILNEVIDVKLELESKQDPNGRSFSKILDERNIRNDYLENVKNHHRDMFEKYRF